MTSAPPAMAVKVVLALAGMATVIQQVPPSGPSMDALEQISKLGIIGFLGTAVWVLWRTLRETTKTKDEQLALKDEVLMANYRSMADALATNNVLVGRMTETLGEMKHTLENIATVRHAVRGGE